MRPRPPKWADRFLEWYCDPDLLEEIQGDSQELFYRRVDEEGLNAAKRKYVWDIIRFLRLSNLRSNKLKINSLIMFNSYLKIGFRNLRKNWGISTINIFGLALAIGCAITIFIFVDMMLHMDQFHSKKDRMYNLINHVQHDSGTELWGANPILLAEELKTNSAAVNNTLRIEYASGNVRYGDKVFAERLSYTDPSFLQMFDFKLKRGSRNVLDNKQSILISYEYAIKYFGDEDPIGKTLTVKLPGDQIQSFLVEGVLEKYPSNSSLKFNLIIPMSNWFEIKGNEKPKWDYLTNATFIELAPGHHPSELYESLNEYVERHNKVASNWTIQKFELLPLDQLSLRDFEIRSSVSQGGHPAGRIALSVIAAMLLILACFNYMNIAVASAAKRLKEIALRKVMGGNRSNIIYQFLTENFILCVIALSVGVLLSYFFFLPGLNSLFPVSIPFSFSSFQVAIIFFGSLMLIIGFASGSYPAFYISKFQPVSILKGNQKLGGKNWFSKILLTLQLVLAFMMVVGCFVFTDNAMYVNEKDWGYKANGVFSIMVNDRSHLQYLRQSAETNPDVESYAEAKGHLGRTNWLTHVDVLDVQLKTLHYEATPNYLQTMNLRLVEGKLFDEEATYPSKFAVINQKFAEKLGWEQPLDKKFTHDSTDYYVIGVVENFYTNNFHDEVSPAFFNIGTDEEFKFFVIKTSEDKLFDVDDQIHDSWFEFAPNDPYNREFQRFTFDDFYRENKGNLTLTGTISVFAMVLACLGLFGLLSFNLQRRMKEFGVRKVLGASRLSILNQANKEYMWIMLVAFVIGAPLGTALISQLLKVIYPDSNSFSAAPIILSVVIIVTTVAGTIIGQLLHATKVNPTEVLRSE
ncbi:MAG: FtsX-like permease family protein [Reichenbachiella sp.]|uniref:ABC transporter permease n=1 Tax=Reichenbachiella sp. TaxID=2184521 RepID=UPI0029661FF6|nr:ABC transporter permease [Reichenbachiella sp.]MDW3208522.1 FtsX-like permease family protein [Reichenbachiella sp.]